MALLLLAPMRVGAQPRVIVKAETRIELGTDRREDRIILSGALRDDLGNDLPDREVEVRLSRAGTRESILRERVRTDDDGRFAIEAFVTTGDYELRATFEGDTHHEANGVLRTIDLDRADVRLSVTVPNGGQLDLDEPTHVIRVRADSDTGRHGGIEIALVAEFDHELAIGTTGEDGRVRFEIASEGLGEPGAGRLKARSRPDADRAEAQTEVPIVRFRRSDLTLEASASEARAGESVVLFGELFNSQGPLGGRAIGVFGDGDTHLTTMLTDREGRFVANLDTEGREPGTLTIVARFESDAPGRMAAESAPVQIAIGTRAVAAWLWAALPIAICLVLLLLIARRAPQRLTALPPAPPPPPPGIAASTRRSRKPAQTAIYGRVIDRSRQEPIAGATATLTSADGTSQMLNTRANGAFAFDRVSSGEHILRVEAQGYAPEETKVTSPHRGQWGEVTVRLENLRDRVLSAYRRVALALIPSSRLWEIWTNREVLIHARESTAEGERLTDLTLRVEDAFYSSEGPSEDDVDRVSEDAERAYVELAHERGATDTDSEHRPR